MSVVVAVQIIPLLAQNDSEDNLRESCTYHSDSSLLFVLMTEDGIFSPNNAVALTLQYIVFWHQQFLVSIVGLVGNTHQQNDYNVTDSIVDYWCTLNVLLLALRLAAFQRCYDDWDRANKPEYSFFFATIQKGMFLKQIQRKFFWVLMCYWMLLVRQIFTFSAERKKKDNKVWVC